MHATYVQDAFGGRLGWGRDGGSPPPPASAPAQAFSGIMRTWEKNPTWVLLGAWGSLQPVGVQGTC